MANCPGCNKPMIDGQVFNGLLKCHWDCQEVVRANMGEQNADDLKAGKDFTIGDIALVIVSTPFGLVFTLFCMHHCWERSRMASRIFKWLQKPLIKGQM